MKKDKIFLILRRIFAAIIDIGIIFMASMMMVIYIGEPIAEVTINISEVRKEYEQKCLEYEIHYYNEETKQYLENPDVTEEQMIAFNNDERVKELSQIQSGAAVIELYGSASLASIIFYVIIP